jgi:hypothetical protein
MDYKFFVLLFILLILVFLLVKEMNNVKEELNLYHEKTREFTKSMIEAVSETVKSETADSVKKINLMNSNYMASIRRMNKLENQPIVGSASNNYTDSESVVRNKTGNKIIYMSDVGNNVEMKPEEFNIAFPSEKMKGGDSEKSVKSSTKVQSVTLPQLTMEKIKDDVSDDSSSSTSDDEQDSSTKSSSTSSSTSKSSNTQLKKSSSESTAISVCSTPKDDEASSGVSVDAGTTENNSVQTAEIDIKNLVLQPIAKYKKTDLEKMAKRFSILTHKPTTDKDPIRHPLKKEELYNKIKEFIKTTKKNA